MESGDDCWRKVYILIVLIQRKLIQYFSCFVFIYFFFFWGVEVERGTRMVLVRIGTGQMFRKLQIYHIIHGLLVSILKWESIFFKIKIKHFSYTLLYTRRYDRQLLATSEDHGTISPRLSGCHPGYDRYVEGRQYRHRRSLHRSWIMSAWRSVPSNRCENENVPHSLCVFTVCIGLCPSVGDQWNEGVRHCPS